MNVMAIVAHMDDAEIHCGGVLRKYVKQGHKVTVLIVTNGNKGSFEFSPEEITQIRREEQRVASKRLGEEEPMFLDYEDNLMLDCRELRLELTECIRRVNPAVIFTHCPTDGSNDHAATSQAVLKTLIGLRFPNMPVESTAMEKMPQVFFIEPAGGIGFVPEVYVNITEEMDDKMYAFSAHESQTAYDPRYSDDAEIVSRFRGFQAGHEYAEGFIAHRFFGHMPDYSILP